VYALRFALTILLLAELAGCASTAPRLARSSHGCMRAVVIDKVPADLPERRAHCIAAGLIARYCSSTEAYMAGAGKEVIDLIGPGNAEWADWKADRAGIDCARDAKDDLAIATCCSDRGY
jgi:hypothetical protein